MANLACPAGKDPPSSGWGGCGLKDSAEDAGFPCPILAPLFPPCPQIPAWGVRHLQDFALGALLKEQRLLVGWVAGFLHHFGLLLGQADTVLQQVNFHVGGCVGKRVRSRLRAGSCDGPSIAPVPIAPPPSPTLSSHLPGMDLEPIFGMSPLAWITSTSSCPLRSAMPTWTSPGAEGRDWLSTLPDGHLPAGTAAALGWAGPHRLSLLVLPKAGGRSHLSSLSIPTPPPAPHPQHPALKRTEHPTTGCVSYREFGGRTKPSSCEDAWIFEQPGENRAPAPSSPPAPSHSSLPGGFFFFFPPHDGKRGWD